MQEQEEDVGNKNHTDVRANRQRGRKDRWLRGEVEPMGERAQDEFGKGAAAQSAVSKLVILSTVGEESVLHVIEHGKLCVDDDIDIAD